MERIHTINTKRNPTGFTLIELVMVIFILGVLVSLAVKEINPVLEGGKVEETRYEMDALAFAITGRTDLHNNGIRIDFGYVGDVGSMPPNLDALYSNPGGYATWKGPYISRDLYQDPDDYKNDAWQIGYLYSGGTTITSTGSGSNIVRQLTASMDHLLRNTVNGNIYDLDGTPPGSDYRDSVSVELTIPDGVGGLTVRSLRPDIGGYFSFDSIPIGNHDLEVVYFPTGDTIRRFVTVLPNSRSYRGYFLASDVWTSDTLRIIKVSGSDSLYSDCNGFYFWIENVSDNAISIDSVTLTWSSPTAFYRYVRWNGVIVFDRTNPKAGSGEKVGFSSARTIDAGELARLDFYFFKRNQVGGPGVDLNNIDFNVEFSDGSAVTVSTGGCP